MTTPIADFVVSLGTDGRIASQGSLSTILAKDKKLSAQVAKENEVIEKAEHEVDPEGVDKEAKKNLDGKLIVEEEVPVGHVTWAASMLNYDSSRVYSDYLVSEIIPRKRDGREGAGISLLGCFPLNSRTEENPRQP